MTKTVSVTSPKPPGSPKIAKARRTRRLPTRRSRTGDARPTLNLSEKRDELVDQVANALRNYVQFSNGTGMYDEEGHIQHPFQLQEALYTHNIPEHPITEQAVLDACKLIRKNTLIPTAELVSSMPQLAPDGVVLTQPGCAGKRTFTSFHSTKHSESTNVLTAVTPSFHDLVTSDPCERDEEYMEEVAGLVAAIIAPCLLSFKGHMEFFTHPTTAAWLMPMLGVRYASATLPTKAKVAALRRTMQPAAALNGHDVGSLSTTKMILRHLDIPVYRIWDQMSHSSTQIAVCNTEKPRGQVLAELPTMIIEAFRATPPLPASTTFREALDAVLKALGLPGTEAIVDEARVAVPKPKKVKAVETPQ
jgi:hypothetical protein